jgi:hypothetical protein
MKPLMEGRRVIAALEALRHPKSDFGAWLKLRRCRAFQNV